MPDARVQAAVDHWAPRFVQAGVDYSDFVATTAGVERWEDWYSAWCRNADMHAGLAEDAAAKGHRLTAGEAWARATVAYHFAKFVWMVDPVRSRAAADKAVAAMGRVHEYLDPTAERLEVPLDGGRVVGNLRRPAGETRPHSCCSCRDSTPPRRSSSGSRTSSSTAGWPRCRWTDRARGSRATTCRSGPTTTWP